MIILCVVLAAIGGLLLICIGRGGSYYDKNGNYTAVSTTSSFRHCMNHPALQEMGRYVLPWERGAVSKITQPLSIGYMCTCLGYHAQTVVNGINFLIEMRTQEKLYTFDYYTDQEKQCNPHLDTTKLIYIPGDLGAPFALVIAGGGFNSVCMMQEAFPVAQQLHKKGYHVFMLKYRVGALPEDRSATDKRERAFSDLHRGMQYIFQNAEKWQISLKNYSVWGFSAGARMTLAWTTHSKYSYHASGLPKPALQVPIYTVPENITPENGMPSTFMVMGTKDSFWGKEGCVACSEFCRTLNILEVPAIFEEYEGLGHGFGLGTGTPAEGWLDRATQLWERTNFCNHELEESYADRSDFEKNDIGG